MESMTYSSSVLVSSRNFRWNGLRILCKRYSNSRKCLSSKVAVLILLWIFLELLIYFTLIQISSYPFFRSFSYQYYEVLKMSFPSLIVFFYPIAGLLADIKFGRYRTILASLWLLVIGSPFLLIGSALIVAFLPAGSKPALAVVVIGSSLLCIGLLLFVCAVVAFNANIIQTGLDQLYDSPVEDQNIFILWYIWTYNAANFLVHLIKDIYFINNEPNQTYFYILGSLSTSIALVFIFALYIVDHNKEYVMHSRIVNPYILVYKVTMFARHHKVPVHRSAFTFCEDAIPRGLDLGKRKYGGPFSTEEVEDVKVFYGILRILFSIGPVFFLGIPASYSEAFKAHLLGFADANDKGSIRTLFLDSNLLYYLEIVILFPLYIFFVRPLISYYILGTRARMGIGMGICILVVIVSLLIDIAAHEEDTTYVCMFNTSINEYFEHPTAAIKISPWLSSGLIYIVIFQQTVYYISDVLVMVSMYEFIFSQSPYAMKGLIMGLSFTVIGIFKTLGALSFLPFVIHWSKLSKPSCGTVYFSLNIAIGIVALLVYVWQARTYKNRMRDEVCHVQRLVEEVYSKLPQNPRHS